MHLIRAGLRYVNYRDKKKVATALRPIYTAANADDALAQLDAFDAAWGARYPACVQAWRAAWEHVIPFLALPDELRKAVYTTDESVKGSRRVGVGFRACGGARWLGEVSLAGRDAGETGSGWEDRLALGVRERRRVRRRCSRWVSRSVRLASGRGRPPSEAQARD